MVPVLESGAAWLLRPLRVDGVRPEAVRPEPGAAPIGVVPDEAAGVLPLGDADMPQTLQ